jgi:hypothetical protein
VPYYGATTIMDKFDLFLYDTTITSATGDNVVVAQYQTNNRFSSSTLGIEDPTGQIGIQCIFNQTRHRGCAPLGPNRAIKYTTDTPIVYISESFEDLNGAIKISPNPFKTTMFIQMPYSLSTKSKIKIYNSTGRLVKNFTQLIWDGKDEIGKKLPTGVYLVRFENPNTKICKKVVLTR